MMLTLKDSVGNLVNKGDYAFIAPRGQANCMMKCPVCGDVMLISGTDPERCAKCPLQVFPALVTHKDHQFTIKEGEALDA
jgi:hypothetical protein